MLHHTKLHLGTTCSEITHLSHGKIVLLLRKVSTQRLSRAVCERMAVCVCLFLCTPNHPLTLSDA